ncbi:hypothetical protein C8Q70DRAFT_1053062 [Cubamyces menziesii]|uniref:Protein kinase domain-containing protein n=1 Tax=Trametes cubensis TaxID=1111947 RepID=A0AAD7THD9_9APHY|nr:hypothetical protein C8Q70DRAFT_1053062 [Cubamyces menziesii]KAJ8457358.1 hypothetical protein ONZ51_g11581 [Trametes cubensis]
MAPPTHKDTGELQVTFNWQTQYTFMQPSRLFPYTQVAIAGEAEKRTFHGAPLILTYDGAHCVYRATMVRRGTQDRNTTIPVDVALKWVAGKDRIERLKREAEVYEKMLGPVRGVAVPQYYGFFIGTVESTTVACMILEWCEGFPIDNVRELNRQRMIAATRLHEAGVFHGQLLDPRHFIPMRDGTLRIVDFSMAKAHKCPGSVPLSMDPNGDPRPTESCGELDVMESRFGVDAERHGRQLRWANGMYPELVRSFYYIYD